MIIQNLDDPNFLNATQRLFIVFGTLMQLIPLLLVPMRNHSNILKKFVHSRLGMLVFSVGGFMCAYAIFPHAIAVSMFYTSFSSVVFWLYVKQFINPKKLG